MKRRIFLILVSTITCSLSISILAQSSFFPGHSHNDYLQQRPLFEALQYGYHSIEIDVHPYDGEVKVAHDADDLARQPTLQSLYLEPIDSILNANGGLIYPTDSIPVTLMIDLKSDKEITLELLVSALRPLEPYLYAQIEGNESWGPIMILLSGSPPTNKLRELDYPYFFIDVQPDLSLADDMTSIVKRYSSSYENLLNLAASERSDYLQKLTKKASDQNTPTRLWATPDTIEMWDELLKFGLSWVNVDNLKAFREYYDEKIKTGELKNMSHH